MHIQRSGSRYCLPTQTLEQQSSGYLKIKAYFAVVSTSTFDMEPSIDIPLEVPGPLKSHLEDDCFWIQRRGKLLCLPSKVNVKQLLQDYYSHWQLQNDDINASLVAEVLDGIKIYFDFTLPDHLLYASEKDQYRTYKNEATSPSSIYGAEHLLRLFVKFPLFLSQFQLPLTHSQMLLYYLRDILTFMCNNRQHLFSEDNYHEATPYDDSTMKTDN